MSATPHTSPHGHGTHLGLLLLRVTVGLTLAAHGTQKLFGWFDGDGLDGTGMWFESIGYPAGRSFALIAGVTETFGGLALALGLLTPLAASAVLASTLNALAVQWGNGFFGFEYELVLVVSVTALALTGPGRYAADRFLPIVRAYRLGYGATAVAVGLFAAGVTLLIRS